jgi:hypothetical protein
MILKTKESDRSARDGAPATPLIDEWTIPGIRVLLSDVEFGANVSNSRIHHQRVWIVEVHYVFLLLMASVLALPATVVVVRRKRAARRRAGNQCESCGYDLRAGHDKCPECGAVSHVKAAR